MKIKQVESLVGISSKNIRFYEEQGLLHPGRAENGYREYGEAEIVRLKQIKFFRKLGISIQQIQRLLNDSITLEDCLREHLSELDLQTDNLKQTKRITISALEQHAADPDHLNIDRCLDEMKQSEMEGVRFVNLNHTDVERKKTLGAILGAGLIIILMLLLICLVLWSNHQQPISGLILAAVIFFPAVIVVCVVAVLIQRLKEIRGGEEDDAAQY